jgi:N-acetyl-anhydromuramyl-L-alanine amidase AmpD
LRFLRPAADQVRPRTRKRTSPLGIRLFQIHNTTGNEIGKAVNEFQATTKGAHFVNDRDGHVVRMASDKYEVKHGGGSGGAVANAWADKTNINGQAIGVENVQGHGEPFTDPQIKSLIGLVQVARKLYPSILINHVIGHCDVYTGKLECPGVGFPWDKLERAGAALAPQAIADAGMANEWGRFFAGSEGKGRELKEGDKDREDKDGTFSVVRKGKVLASGLTLGPVALLNECLHSIGYTPNRNGRNVANFEQWKRKNIGTYGASTRVAIRFFKAHYCIKTRPSPSKDQAVVDEHLARLVLGCHRALTS